VGQWSSSVDCWLALLILLRMVSFLRALEAHCRICARFCTGIVVYGWRVVLYVYGRGPREGLCVVVPPSDVGRELCGWALPPQHVGWCVCGGMPAWSVWVGLGSGLPG
jgi:hypothetical protein